MGELTMKCPVCKTEINDMEIICPICGFFELHTEFVNVSDATKWYEELVLPYRARWLNNDKSADELFSQIEAQLVNSINENKTGNEIEQFDYDIELGGIVLTKYNGNQTNLRIPDAIDGIKVYKLGPDLFRNCTELENVTLPQKLKVIGDRAFLRTGLTHINLPNGLEVIGKLAFSNTYIDDITMPNTLKFIGWRAFCFDLMAKHGLKRIKLNEGIETIEAEAFMNTELSEIVFPKSLQTISKSVCKNCTKLKTAVILGARTLDEDAFYDCKVLEKVALSDGLNEICSCTFRGCKELKKMIIPATVKKISSSGILLSEYKPNNDRKILILNDDVEITGSGWNGNVIFCRVGSSAHHFCRENKIEMKAIDEFFKSED